MPPSSQVHFKGRLLDKLLRKQNLSETALKRNQEVQIKSEQILLGKREHELRMLLGERGKQCCFSS